MNKLILAIVFLTPSALGAWEFPRNPDRFPSLGINFTNTGLSGERTELDSPSVALSRSLGGPVDTDSDSYGADMRLPINDGITLNLSADRLEYHSKFKRRGDIYSESDKMTGYRYSFGLRVYFNK